MRRLAAMQIQKATTQVVAFFYLQSFVGDQATSSHDKLSGIRLASRHSAEEVDYIFRFAGA